MKQGGVMRAVGSLALSMVIAAWVAACTERTTTAPRIEAASSGSGVVTVTAANPDSAPQDTTLDVHVLGSGYDRGSTAQWAQSGVISPSVTTNSTRLVSSAELVANITIAITAGTGSYDIVVTTSKGKKGIGSELFTIRKKTIPPADPAIAFANQSLYVLNTDGTNQAVIGDPSWGVVSPSWSPDGKSIAFTSGYTGIRIVDITVVNGIPVGSHLRSLVDGGDVQSVAWSPRGDTIAFTEGYTSAPPSSLWIIPSGGGTPIDLYDGPAGTEVQWAAWNPDGSRIAFFQQDSGTSVRSLLVLNRTTGTLDTVMLKANSAPRFADWSRDGSRLLFSANPPGPKSQAGERIYVVSPTRLATPTMIVYGDAPSWSPSDDRFVFMGRDPAGIDTYNFATGAVVNITKQSGVMPDWRRF